MPRSAALLGLALACLGAVGAQAKPALVRVESCQGLRVLRLRRAWATRLVAGRLQQLGEAYGKRFPNAPPLWVHDISLQNGAAMRLHVSHREGRDVDLRVPQRGARGYVDATPQTLHTVRTWFLIRRLIQTCDVEFIMLDRALQRRLYQTARSNGFSAEQLVDILQYPRLRHHRHPDNAVVRHYPRHRNHMHVRFRRLRAPLHGRSARRLCGLPPEPAQSKHRPKP